jgi:hypothetical protein
MHIFILNRLLTLIQKAEEISKKIEDERDEAVVSLVRDRQLLGKRREEKKYEKRQAVLSNISCLSLDTILLSRDIYKRIVNLAHSLIINRLLTV